MYPKRTFVGLALFTGQAFLYNAIFFTYALVLTEVYGVGAGSVGLYLLPFAVGNFCGPLFLGRLFDSVGRKPMIAGTYILSGILLVITGLLFDHGTLNATTQTIAWCVIFFFASAGASAAYLTVSEDLPDGDAGDGDRLLLRHRHPRRRLRRAAALRRPHPER